MCWKHFVSILHFIITVWRISEQDWISKINKLLFFSVWLATSRRFRLSRRTRWPSSSTWSKLARASWTGTGETPWIQTSPKKDVAFFSSQITFYYSFLIINFVCLAQFRKELEFWYFFQLKELWNEKRKWIEVSSINCKFWK